ncbi:MAG TPA: HD domain-containing phosphohydrolase [Bryobacteraceae bacterium]|nr:HD domain-containing phosphohydrolase [Bryobacteraceae bacterium]
MTTSILCVDDEPNLLHAIERQFHKRFEIVTAVGPELGLQTIAERGPFAVVVSDLRMPRMDGIQFLAQVRQTSPDTVRIMLTGQADLTAAMEAVNQGNIFQFLTKPCPPEMIGRALDAALRQHGLIQAERELLERTLTGSVEVLSEILGLVNPQAFGRAQRIRRYVAHIADALKLADRWQYDLAAMLSQIGCVTVPPDILDKIYAAQPLDDSEKRAFASHCAVAHDLIAKIPRLENVAEMVAGQTVAGRGTGGSDRVGVGSSLLKTAADFDEQIMRGRAIDAILATMRAGGAYNASYLDALRQAHVEESQTETRAVRVADLRKGMLVGADVRTTKGLLLLAKGREITEAAIARLISFQGTVGVAEPIPVLVRKAATLDRRACGND